MSNYDSGILIWSEQQEQNLRPETETFAEAAARLRARTPPQTTGSSDLIRQDRDRDHHGPTV